MATRSISSIKLRISLPLRKRSSSAQSPSLPSALKSRNWAAIQSPRPAPTLLTSNCVKTNTNKKCSSLNLITFLRSISACNWSTNCLNSLGTFTNNTLKFTARKKPASCPKPCPRWKVWRKSTKSTCPTTRKRTVATCTILMMTFVTTQFLSTVSASRPPLPATPKTARKTNLKNSSRKMPYPLRKMLSTTLRQGSMSTSPKSSPLSTVVPRLSSKPTIKFPTICPRMKSSRKRRKTTSKPKSWIVSMLRKSKQCKTCRMFLPTRTRNRWRKRSLRGQKAGPIRWKSRNRNLLRRKACQKKT